jgi:small-conductance mechanosensitive channel
MINPNPSTDDNQSSESTLENTGGMERLEQAIRDQLAASMSGDETPQNDEQPGYDHRNDGEEAEEQVQEHDESLENADDQHDEEPAQEPKENRGWQKRIDKLTARNKSIEEQNDELRQQIYDLKRQTQDRPKDPEPVNKLALSKNTIYELESLEHEAIEAERWAKRNLAKYKRDPDAVEESVKERTGNVPDDVEAFLEDILFNSEDLLRSDIPNRKKQLINQQKSFEVATKHYPWLSDPRSEPAAWVNNIISEFGNTRLADIPNVHQMVARSLVGQYIEQEKSKKGNKSMTPTPEPTRQPGKPAVQRRQVSTGEADLMAARKRVEKERTPEAMAQWIKSRANLR